MIACDNSDGKLKVSTLLEGSKIRFTGRIKEFVPFRFTTAFKNNIKYIECDINKSIGWLHLYQLNSFAEYGNES